MRPHHAAALALACAALAWTAIAAPSGQATVFLPRVTAPERDPDLAAIALAAEGLLYPSETDAPFVPLALPAGMTPAEACAAEAAPEEPVEVGDVGRVLDGPARRQPWMSPQELATAARFATLRDTITARLDGPLSCRVGRISIRVLILGVAPSGAVVGLRTLAVET